MASLKKSSKKSKAGASARTTAKAKSSKRSAAAETKRTVAKAVASPSARSRKAAAGAATTARVGQARKGTAKTNGKSAQKSARTVARAGTSKSKAAARRNIERKTTTVEMRNTKTASAQKAGAARAKTTIRQPATSRRAITKPVKAAKVTKATKIIGTINTVKPVETLVENVKDVAVKAKSTAKTVVQAVTDAAPGAKAAPKTAVAKAPAKPETSASTILLETIRRVGQAAAAEAKARIVAPAAAAVAGVVSAPAAEPAKTTAPAAAAATASAPASPVPPTAPTRPPFGGPSVMGRPGFPGDSRLHQLQPRPVAKPGSPRPSFKLEEFVVYPAHGVGQIVGIEEQEVAGFKLELYVISFAKDKMTLKVPTPKVVSVGMRKLAEPALVQKALDVLTGRARIKRTMWSRRAQEYEAKINSGDLIAIAEVIRDLYRSEAQPEQSYSERQLYEAALDRMGREIGAVQKLTETETLKLIETQLQKGPRRGAKPEGEGEGEAENEVEEAAA
jgi:CarD family transcriptional regulator